MGLYDNFRLPESDQYISTYAGLPIEEVTALGNKLEQKYMQGIEGVSAFNVMRDNVKVLKSDSAFKDDIFDKTSKDLNAFAEKGDYENSLPAIMRASSGISGNKDLRKAMSSYKYAEDYLSKLDKALFDNDITKDQYAHYKNKVSEYKGVLKGDNIKKYLLPPGKPLNLTEELTKIAKLVEADVIEKIGSTPDATGKIPIVTTTHAPQTQMEDAMRTALANDSDLRAWQQELVEVYGPEEAQRMVSESMSTALNTAYTVPKVKTTWTSLDDGPSNNTGTKNKHGLSMIGPTEPQEISMKTFEVNTDNYANARDMYKEAEEKLRVFNARFNPYNEDRSAEKANLNKELDDAKKVMDKAGGDLTATSKAFSGNFDMDTAYTKFKEEVKNLSERESQGLPKNKEEFADYLYRNSEYDSRNWQQIKGALSDTYGDQILKSYSKDFYDYIESAQDEPISTQAMVLSGYPDGKIGRFTKSLNQAWKDNQLNGFITMTGDDQIKEYLDREYPDRDRGTETIAITTEYDQGNAKNVLQLSFVNGSDEDSPTKTVLMKPGMGTTAGILTEEISSIMLDVATDPNVAPSAQRAAEKYVIDSHFMPQLIKQGLNDGKLVEFKYKDQDGEIKRSTLPLNMPEYKGEGATFTMQRIKNNPGDPSKYKLVITDASGATFEETGNSPDELMATLWAKNKEITLQILENSKKK